jgi:hypothetical protein
MPAVGVSGCWARARDEALGPGGEGKAQAATVASQARVMACPVWIRSGLATAWQPAGGPHNRALMPGRVTPQITVQAGRVAAWWAGVIKVRGRRSSPQRDPPRLRWPGSPGRWRRRLCPAAQTRRQRRRLLARPRRLWRSANESGCPWRDGPACRPPWREVILACRPWRGDMTGIPELPGSLTRHGWARFRGSARRISSFSGRWAAYCCPVKKSPALC